MQTIKTYLYDQIVEAQILDTTIFTTRNRKVYSSPIKLYQGINNPLQVIVKNQDQKAVDLSVPESDPAEPAYYVQACIQDPINKLTVVCYDVNFSDLTKGRGTFTVEKAVVDDLEQRLYKLTLSIEPVDTSVKTPLYIDDNFGVPLDLMILPAYWSEISPAPGIEQSVIDGGTI